MPDGHVSTATKHDVDIRFAQTAYIGKFVRRCLIDNITERTQSIDRSFDIADATRNIAAQTDDSLGYVGRIRHFSLTETNGGGRDRCR